MRSPARVDGYAPIRDYAVIGNKRTAALVALDGSIDWMCLPAFDSGTVFGALLDAGSGGRYVLTPESPYYAERRYVEHSNVLETTYSTADGTVRVTEALNLQEVGPLPWNELVRRVEGVAGRVSMRWSVAPRFEWGAVGGALEWRHGVPVIVAGAHALALQSFDAGEPEGTAGPGGAQVSGSFAIREGQSALLALSCFYDEPYLLSGRHAFESRLAQTVDFWRRWAAIVSYEGPWREAVVRSALVLELLVYAPTGAMVAAPTSSLPEAIGGSRNWDYRYSWLRDTAYTLEAMLRIGYRDQVHSSLAWVLQTIKRTHPRVGVFYHLNGEPPGETVELDLEGYRMSRPVRYGNGAAGATAGQLGRRRSVRRRWNDANSRLISASQAGPRMPRPLEAAGTRACQADDEVRAKGRVPAGHRRRASERTPTMDTGGKSAQAAPRPTGVGRTDEPA
ncbi:MAG TPA: glycoside hydrolase family 15 protein, partial [Thermoleophilaceae bacterium]|nr:glycoside hydrolase family 15 protein [Thermoleophilaceae bacterium]